MNAKTKSPSQGSGVSGAETQSATELAGILGPLVTVLSDSALDVVEGGSEALAGILSAGPASTSEAPLIEAEDRIDQVARVLRQTKAQLRDALLCA